MTELSPIMSPAQQQVEHFMRATNAYAEQLRQNGEPYKFMSRAEAADVHKQIIKGAIAFANPQSANHNKAYNAFKDELGGNASALNRLNSVGRSYFERAQKLAKAAMAGGAAPEAALEAAYNSIAGNPGFDHFGNLNLLAGQLYQENVGVATFLENGDAFAVPVEGDGTNLDTSRFRAPTESVSGSAKILQGDINPVSTVRNDANRTQINLYNEFKNALTIYSNFTINQAQRDQVLGYQRSVNPALAGFILQNRYFNASQMQVLKEAELMFWDGLNAAGSYTPNVGGTYGLLSPAIQLLKTGYNTATPTPAVASDWVANTTKLIQVIDNYYSGQTVAAPLSLGIDPSLYYKDIVRLANLAAQGNVKFDEKHWTLFVPTSFWAAMMQYPGTQSGGLGQGTFNKNLDEMVRTATGGIISKINIVPASMCDYRATNSFGSTANAYNYMALVAQGCVQEKKPIILPGQTAVPYVTSSNVSAVQMDFYTQYLFGGPMFMQLGGAFLMRFARATPGT